MNQPETRENLPFLSVITPAYNEAENLPLLYLRLREVMDTIAVSWEWIVIDDHSMDVTFNKIQEIATHDDHIHGFRLARNFGSHAAITCGLHQARGDCAIVLAADLQDPPETFPELIKHWQQGYQVVWAVRAQREGESARSIGFAWLYYFLMRNIAGIKSMPATGADFFLIDRRVIDAYRNFNERNASLLALITWMGFRQTSIFYNKKAREHGRSGWSLGKKIKLVIDSITSFSYLPIRIISYMGIVVGLLGFLYASIAVINAFLGKPPQGWTSLIIVVLIVGGLQMCMLGVLGEYLWRALDEVRHRPQYIIEEQTEG